MLIEACVAFVQVLNGGVFCVFSVPCMICVGCMISRLVVVVKVNFFASRSRCTVDYCFNLCTCVFCWVCVVRNA